MDSVTLDMEQYDCPYIDASDEWDVSFTGMHWDFDARAAELETRILVEGADVGAVDDGLAALRDHSQMAGFELLSRQGDQAVIRNRVAETNAMRVVRDNRGYLTGPFVARDGREVWHVGFDSQHRTDAALSELERENEFVVESRESIDFADYFDLVQHVGPATRLLDGCRELTDVERRTLATAYEVGYFEVPRRADLGDVASEFDVSRAAVSKTIRRAHQKVVGRVVDSVADLEEP